MATLNTNLTTTASLSSTMKEFWDKKLLMDMKPKLLHMQFGQKRPIPRNNGLTVEFRKWTPFAAALTALTEGTPPDGQTMTMTRLTATVAQYGGYVAISDKLNMSALDPVISAAIEQMADQGALTLDTLTRNVLTESADATNVLYAAGSERSSITTTDVLTSTLLRKAVRALKKAKAPMFSSGGRPYYVGIVGPDTSYDLQSDSKWEEVAKYQDREKIYSGEIGMLYGVKIIETTESKVFSADPYILEEGTNINATATLTTISSNAYVAETPSIQVTATATQLGSAGIAALANKYIVVNGYRRKIVSAAAHATPANGTILTLDATLPGTATVYNSLTIYPSGGGKTANDVAATLVMGMDAYGLIDIAGSGAVQSMIKAAGSAGTSDPLDQVSTVGWKVPAFAAKILMPDRILRIEHGMSDR